MLQPVHTQYVAAVSSFVCTVNLLKLCELFDFSILTQNLGNMPFFDCILRKLELFVKF